MAPCCSGITTAGFSEHAGHLLREQSWGFDGQRIVIDQRYDQQGRLAEIDQARFWGDTATRAIKRSYDALDRLIATAN